MASGKVKWFDNAKGFGFIAQESGKDIFVHHTAILGKGYKTLEEGEVVSYEMVESDKGPKAEKVQRAQAEDRPRPAAPANHQTQQRNWHSRYQSRSNRSSSSSSSWTNRAAPRRTGWSL